MVGESSIESGKSTWLALRKNKDIGTYVEIVDGKKLLGDVESKSSLDGKKASIGTGRKRKSSFLGNRKGPKATCIGNHSSDLKRGSSLRKNGKTDRRWRQRTLLGTHLDRGNYRRSSP